MAGLKLAAASTAPDTQESAPVPPNLSKSPISKKKTKKNKQEPNVCNKWLVWTGALYANLLLLWPGTTRGYVSLLSGAIRMWTLLDFMTNEC